MKINYKTQFIEQYIKLNKITKKEFAKKVGISYYMLKQIYNNKSVGMRLILPILKTLNITSKKFFEVLLRANK